MKKAFFVFATCVLAYHCKAMSIDSWAIHSHKFTKETDLIRGYILSSDEILKNSRFSGNIKYFYNQGEKYNGDSCSFKDHGFDSMSDLLIQLFPSCGRSLNAQGNGTITFIEAKQTDFIVGMFNIDTEVRQNRESSIIFSEIDAIDSLASDNPQKNILMKQFGAKYFQLTHGKVEYFERLFRLGKNIANAIMSEQQEESSTTFPFEQKPYPPFYTNNLICAYVWNALPANKLDELAKKLGYTDKREAYQSELTTRIFEEIHKDPSVVPFYAGQRIIINSVTEYNGQKFSDCVETTIRHLFSCIFCKSILNEKKEYTGEVTLDLARIPEKAEKLRGFFAPEGELRNIRELANDGSPEIRKEWATIVSGHATIGENESLKPLISYADGDHEMYGGWSNIIKTFCFLMDGYSATQEGSATPRKLAAEKRIKEVNESVKMGTFAITKDTLLETINDLLGIRTDVEMIAEEIQIPPLKNVSSDVEGYISIYPKNHEKCNRLNFVSKKTHAELQSIPRTKLSSAQSSSIAANDYWIESLYNDRELAIRGKEIDRSYPSLRKSAYPLLDFSMRINGDIRQEWIIPTLCDILNISTTYTDAVARMFFDVDTELNLFNFLNTAQEREVPLQHLINICKLIAEHSNCIFNTVSAIKFLTKYNPNATDKFLCNISEKSDLRDLVIQRMAFGRCEETDPIIENFVKNHPTEEVFEFLCNIFCAYAVEKAVPSDVPPFSETMLTAFIPHISSKIEKIKSNSIINEIDIDGTLAILDLIEFKEIPQVVAEFTERAKKIKKPHFFPLIPNINRSQAKLNLLLPISYVCETSLADRIFEEYSEAITPSIATSIIMKVSEENIPSLFPEITEEKEKFLTSFIQELIGRDNYFFDELVFKNDGKIRQIIQALSEKYGKFSDKIAEELIEMFPEFLHEITSHAEFSPKLKEILLDKYTNNNQLFLTLLDSDYAFDERR
ncbi:MAG: hypothetical protein IJ730_04605 [Alphaproteobacteria bacterium]|nr:hypothetical protein [Alphaproteobacteria bacterium]